jgi:hypothetical protein
MENCISTCLLLCPNNLNPRRRCQNYNGSVMSVEFLTGLRKIYVVLQCDARENCCFNYARVF